LLCGNTLELGDENQEIGDAVGKFVKCGGVALADAALPLFHYGAETVIERGQRIGVLLGLFPVKR
jgi:hypothetical protein